MRLKNLLIFLCLLCICIFSDVQTAFCDVGTDDYSAVLDEVLDDSTVNEAIKEIFGEQRPGIRQLIEGLLSGEMNVLDVFNEVLPDSILKISGYKNIFIKLLILSVFCALFGFLPKIFGNEQSAQMGHYIAFIILAAYLISILSDALLIVKNSIDVIILLMNALIPVYLVAIALTGAISTAGISAGVFELLIYLAQQFIYNYLCPASFIYALVGFANQLLEADRFSKLVDLVKKLILWILKGMLTMIVGFQFLQNFISPYVDKFNSSVTKQTLEAIPGVGDIASSGIGIAVGAAFIVKNSIGVVAMILLLALTAAPVIKLMIYTLILMATNALLQPVLYGQTLKLIDVSVSAIKLMLKILLTVMLLFLISIALLSVGAGGV